MRNCCPGRQRKESMSDRIKVLIPEDRINERVRELGSQISRDYAGKEISLICVLKGGVYFLTALSQQITVPCTIDFMCVSSYGADTVSSGDVKIKKDLDASIEGKDVLIVEDIIDSGHTLACLRELLFSRKPASLKICTLLDKPDRREVKGFSPEYCGFVIPDAFVIGYGLDYDQRYRNLPYVGVVEQDSSAD